MIRLMIRTLYVVHGTAADLQSLKAHEVRSWIMHFGVEGKKRIHPIEHSVNGCRSLKMMSVSVDRTLRHSTLRTRGRALAGICKCVSVFCWDVEQTLSVVHPGHVEKKRDAQPEDLRHFNTESSDVCVIDWDVFLLWSEFLDSSRRLYFTFCPAHLYPLYYKTAIKTYSKTGLIL